jgi:hypothetical protein
MVIAIVESRSWREGVLCSQIYRRRLTVKFQGMYIHEELVGRSFGKIFQCPQNFGTEVARGEAAVGHGIPISE